MAIHTMRKIQRKHNDDVFYMSQKGKDDKGPPPGLRAGGGARTNDMIKYEVNSMRRKRTSLSVVLFDKNKHQPQTVLGTNSEKF
eukprot:2177037-Amphidinium_carterae.1